MIIDTQTLDNTFPMHHLHTIAKAIGSYDNLRIVGGASRDLLLGESSSILDIDLAINVSPELAMTRLMQAGINCLNYGLRHGTVVAILDGITYEITATRKDSDCNGRHAEVTFTENWEEDSCRRDFTINAIYIDLNGHIYDYHGGISDIKTKTIRFIGSPQMRILEDHLRILRYFRMLSYVGFENVLMEYDELLVCNAHLLLKISGERIRNEMCKLFAGHYASHAMRHMKHCGVTPYIMPFVKVLPEDEAKFNKNNNIANIVYISLLNNADLDMFKNLWKMSNAECASIRKCYEFIKRSRNLLESLDIKDHVRALYSLGLNDYMNCIDTLGIEHNSTLQPNKDAIIIYNTKKLPITGLDFIELGISGHSIRKCLQLALDIWINSEFTMDKENIIKLAVSLDSYANEQKYNERDNGNIFTIPKCKA